MKTPREVWLYHGNGGWSFSFDPPLARYRKQAHRMVPATDVEVKRLKQEHAEMIGRLTRACDFNERHGVVSIAEVRAALKPRKAKREHLCGTSSSDEQVLCDDPKCPRSRNFKRAKR